jgi:hypothetical protein
MIWIVNAKIAGVYKVKIEFNDGLSGIIDFRNILKNDHRFVVRELLDINKFSSCKVQYDTLCWENGVDFAPEYLYEQIKNKKHYNDNNNLQVAEVAQSSFV